MDLFTKRLKEHTALVNGIKEDIKSILIDKGYNDCGGFAKFEYTCKPDRFIAVGIDFGNLYFRDNEGTDWHSDNLFDVSELMTILRAMYHILPKNVK